MTVQSTFGAAPFPFMPIRWDSSTATLDATGDRVAYVFRVPKTGSIDRVSFRTGSVSSAATLNVGLETVTSGAPSESAYGGSVSGTQAAPAGNTTYEVTLGTPATATVGDLAAVVIKFDGAAGNVAIQYRITAGIGSTGWGFPYSTVNAAGTYAATQGGIPNISLRYNDGNYYSIGGVPAGAYATNAFNSGSTPDEIGNIITIPYAATAWGFWLHGIVGNAADVVLYDADGSTALKTTSLDGVSVGGTSNGHYTVPFAAGEQSLSINTTYRLVLKPTTTSNVTICRWTGLAAGHQGMWHLGQNCYETSRSDAGAWTNTTEQRVSIGLMLSAFSDNVGTGGGGGPLVGGRLVQ